MDLQAQLLSRSDAAEHQVGVLAGRQERHAQACRDACHSESAHFHAQIAGIITLGPQQATVCVYGYVAGLQAAQLLACRHRIEQLMQENVALRTRAGARDNMHHASRHPLADLPASQKSTSTSMATADSGAPAPGENGSPAAGAEVDEAQHEAAEEELVRLAAAAERLTVELMEAKEQLEEERVRGEVLVEEKAALQSKVCGWTLVGGSVLGLYFLPQSPWRSTLKVPCSTGGLQMPRRYDFHTYTPATLATLRMSRWMRCRARCCQRGGMRRTR
jgi:hypothetical protein